MPLAPALVFISALSLATALVSNSWSFDDGAAFSLEEVVFSFNIANAPHKSGYFFAQQFNFEGVDQPGYTGIQPREDPGGKSIIRAVFASLENGTVPSYSGDPECPYSPEGVPGVFCTVDVPGDYSHTWNLKVERIGGTGDRYWHCTLIDVDTGEERYVGEYLLPGGADNMVIGQTGFVDYLPWKDAPNHTCDSLPPVEVTFLNPTSYSASGGTISKPEEDGDCAGKVDYSVTRVSEGWDIKLGF